LTLFELGFVVWKTMHYKLSLLVTALEKSMQTFIVLSQAKSRVWAFFVCASFLHSFFPRFRLESSRLFSWYVCGSVYRLWKSTQL